VVDAINSRNDIGMIAVDEIHKIANKQSQQADGLLKLKAEYKIGATGTLITNSPLSSYTALK
jgi:SNF2 family DNA or RNA helicase